MQDERMIDYIRGLVSYDNDLLPLLDAEAPHRDDIQPFIEPELAKLLGLLIRLGKARRVLELGTGIGYSTIWLAEAVKETGGVLVAMDNHERTSREAAGNFGKAGIDEVLEFRFGDVEELIPEAVRAGEQYDLIFQDCGKYVYDIVYEDIYTLLTPGGLLVTDDTLLQFDPKIRKGLGVHVQQYNSRLFADARYYSTILPVGQGAALSLKR